MEKQDNSGKGNIFQKGQRIGEVYEVIRLLGQSAIDDAYLVRSLVTGKRYVLKRLLHAFTDEEEYPNLFEGNKHLICDYIHPNIVGVHKAGFFEDDFFCVYTYVAAAGGKPKTLYDRICVQGKMHEFQAKNVFLQICGGLNHAVTNQKKSIVHLSLKPSNILFDSSHLVRISDFAKQSFVPETFLRKLLTAAGYDNTTLTRLGVPPRLQAEHSIAAPDTENTSEIDMTSFSIIGKKEGHSRQRLISTVREDSAKSVPIYLDDIPDARIRSIIETFSFMSPEQWNGGEPDERSNIYSLGLILYFMLTGRRMDPDNYIPLDSTAGNDYWNEVILKCTRKDPEQRYLSIGHLQQAVIQGKTVNAHFLPLSIYSGMLIFCGVMIYLIINWIYSPGSHAEQMEMLNRAITESGVDVSSRLSVLEITVAPEGAGLEVSQNGGAVKKVSSIPAGGFKYILAPGDYDLEIYKAGYQSIRQKLKLSPGRFNLALTLNANENMAVKHYIYRKGLERPETGFPFIIPKLQIELLPIDPGSFDMGYSEEAKNMGIYEKRAERQNIPYGFWMAKYEITQEVFEEIMLSNPSVYGANRKRPVERVSWNAAVEFCKRLTDLEKTAGRLIPGYEYRLPDEREWEYCCRANTITDYNFGNNVNLINEYAVNVSNSMNETGNVGAKNANRWGLHDMHGNVAEWTYNFYVENDADSSQKPAYVLRGGSWKDTPVYMRNSSRVVTDSPGYADSHTGFRIVLAPERKPSP